MDGKDGVCVCVMRKVRLPAGHIAGEHAVECTAYVLQATARLGGFVPYNDGLDQERKSFFLRPPFPNGFTFTPPDWSPCLTSQ